VRVFDGLPYALFQHLELLSHGRPGVRDLVLGVLYVLSDVVGRVSHYALSFLVSPVC
jgi:hypothetical protein